MSLPFFNTTQIVAALDSTHHWTTGTITYSLTSTPADVLSGDTTETSTYLSLNSAQTAGAALAFELWGDILAIPLVQVSEAGGTVAQIDVAGFNQTPSSSATYAETWSSWDGVGNKIKATAWFNDSYNPSSGYVSGDLTNPTIDNYNFLTYIHELGHAFGLSHPGNYNGATGNVPSSYQDSLVYSVMSYWGPSSARGTDGGLVATGNWLGYDPQTPMLDDVLAIQTIYGVPTTTRAGDTTYGFHSTLAGVDGGIYDFTHNAHPIMCIFDSSGNNTLDLSGDANNDVIDMHAGAFSSVMGLTNNVSIAYSTIIDGAVAGSGTDTIYGNNVADIIYGGSGNDTIICSDGVALSAADGSIYRLYQATLNREPDLAGIKNWEAALNSGQSLVQVTSGFVNSAEFQAAYGTLDNTHFVTLLYNNVLHRTPDTAGLANWVGQLDAGATRSAVVDGFSESIEFQNNSALDTQAYATTAIDDTYLGQVYRLYQATLDRGPDVGGFQGWIGALQGGQSLAQITTGFVNSAEFQGTYGTLDNTQFVTLLYNNVLHRAPDAAGLSYWSNLLNTGTTHSAVVDGFSESAELITSSHAALTTFVQTAMAPIWSDTLIAGTGNDKLFGGLGADTFQFHVSNGLNNVYGFQAWDHVQFTGFGYGNTAAALSHITQVGQDAVFIDQGETIIFHHTQLAIFQDTAGLFILA
ncbi:MAG: DUF4214 domain-containing protein [Pseudomonadota bacterium]|nr:DUF4214 domain-containing protein [Pseudomonadota bacterium]